MKSIIATAAVLLLTSCAEWIPTPSHPCPNLYCAQWTVMGTDVMVCAETPHALDLKLRALKAQQAQH